MTVLLTCLACSDTSKDDGPASLAQRNIEIGAGARLIVPAGAFEDDVEVTVTTSGDAPPTPGGQAGLSEPIDVSAGGAQPDKPLILEFPFDPSVVPEGMQPDRIMGVSSFDEESGEWEAIPVTFDAEARVMRAELDHLSWKWPWEWDWPAIGAAINQQAGELIGKRAPAARCTRGTAVPPWVQSVAVNNDDAMALRSCAESKGDALVIEIVNNRPYGVVMQLDAPAKWTWVADPADPAHLAAKLVLDRTLPEDRLYIPALERATVALEKGAWRSAQLSTDATGATIIATYMALALGDLLTKRTAKLIVEPFVASCVSGFIKTNADAVVASLGAAHELITSTVDCVSEVMQSRALDRALTPDMRGRAAATYKAMGRVAWYLKLFSLEWDTVDLLIDKAVVSGPSTIPTWSRVNPAPDPGVPPEMLGTWCVRGSDECVNFTDLLDENRDGFFDDPSTGNDGSTVHTICLANDLGSMLGGEPACTVAASMYFQYFPAGVRWTCETAVEDDYERCEPDYTADHDISKPRIVHLKNHQQDSFYVDSAPMYQN